MSDQPENIHQNSSAPIGEIEHGPSKFEEFLENNQKKLIILAGVLLLGLIFWVVFDGLRQQAQEEASAAVSAANSIPELRAAAEEHSGTRAAGTAIYRIAKQQWEDLSQKEAIATLTGFIADYPDHPLHLNAKANLGSFHLQLEEFDEAKSNFQYVHDNGGSDSELVPLSLLYLGDISARQGDHDAAKEFYEEVGSLFAEESAPGVKKLALERIALIGVEAPSVKKIAPPTPTEPTPTNTQSPTPTPPIEINARIPDETPENPVPETAPAANQSE